MKLQTVQIPYKYGNNFTQITLYYRINPRRVLEQDNYIGIFDAKDTDRMLDCVNKLLRTTFDGALPRVEHCKLRRIDFCCNALLGNQEEVAAYLDILKRGRQDKTYKLMKYDNKIAKRKTLSKTGLTYKGSNGVTITYYNKYREMAEQGLPMQDIEWLNRMIRIEIQCHRKKIKGLQKKFNVKSVRKFLNRSDAIGAYVFEKYGSRFCGLGAFYPLTEIYQKIDASSYKPKSKEKMRELAKLSSIRRNLDAAVEEFRQTYGRQQTAQTLERFDKLGVSPVIIPKRSDYTKLPNPLSLIKTYYGETW